jgi:hypothetical protein
MLFSAAIICLMGIMFAAQKKASTYYADARDALTSVVITVADRFARLGLRWLASDCL